jgi:hypothetical protein
MNITQQPKKEKKKKEEERAIERLKRVPETIG